MSLRTTFLATCALALAATGAQAAHLAYFKADLVALNESGVAGTAYVTFDGATPEDAAKSIIVQVQASGLKPGPHAAHIHGFADGSASVAPTPDVFDVDTDEPTDGNDGDGFVELTEGAPFYGGILQTLTGLSADDDGNVDYYAEFDVADGTPLDNDDFSIALREIVLHGIDTLFEPVATFAGPDGDIDGFTSALLNFNAVLPIATQKFETTTADMIPPAPSPIPLPASALLLVAGLGGLGAMRRKAA